MIEQNPFKWRHFQADIILLCVRWYLRYALSYRDLEEMMLERGLQVDHTTIYRWVQHYAPELEDHCQVRKGAAPRVLAVLNSFLLGLLDFCGVTNVPKQMRLFDARPHLVARLLLGSLLTFT